MKEKEKTKYTFWQNTKYCLDMLRQENRDYGGKVYRTMLCKIIPSIISPLAATVMLKALVDTITGNVSSEVLVTAVLAFAVLNIIFGAMQKYYEIYFYFFSNRLRFDYCENRFLAKNLSTDYENLENYEKHKILLKAERMFGNSVDGAAIIMSSCCQVIITFSGVSAFMAIIALADPLIIVITLIAGIINLFIGLALTENDIKVLRDLDSNTMKTYYLSRESSNPKPAKDMRIFNIVSWFSPLIDILIYDKKTFLKQYTKKKNFLNFAAALLIFLRDGAVFGVLIYLYSHEKLSAGDFAFYYSVITGAANWITAISNDINVIYRSHLYCDDFRKYLDLEDDEKAVEIIKEIPSKCEIEFQNVSFSYDGKTDVIKDFNFKASAGEKVAIVGMNGAGKTTAMKLLLGFYNPTKGKILINGKDASVLNKKERCKLFSAVFQDIFTLPASIEKNIALCEDVDKDKLNRVIEFADLSEKIESLPGGVNTRLHKDLYPDAVELSGGETQKLLLARAIYKEAPIMILDEPTAALDPIAENDIYTKYSEITKGRTSFYISHRLASTAFCDKVIFIKDGEITETGTHKELMERKGDYYKMYYMQSYYYNEEISGGEVL